MRCSGARLVLVLGAVLLLPASHALAAIKHWNTDANGLYNTSNLWSPSGVPGAGDSVIFDFATTKSSVVTLSSAATSLGLQVSQPIILQMNRNYTTGSILVQAPVGSAGSISVGNGSTLTATDAQIIRGNLSVSGTGITKFNVGPITIGDSGTTKAGVLGINSSGQVNATIVTVNRSGTLNAGGGTLNFDSLSVSGSVTVQGGELSSNNAHPGSTEMVLESSGSMFLKGDVIVNQVDNYGKWQSVAGALIGTLINQAGSKLDVDGGEYIGTTTLLSGSWLQQSGGTFDTLNWNAGATTHIELANTAALQKDSIVTTGALHLLGTPADPLILDIYPPSFPQSKNLVYTIATAAGGITGFDPAALKITIDPRAETFGTYSVVQSGNSLVLYASVPEPGTWLLAVVGGAMLVACRVVNSRANRRRLIAGYMGIN